MARMTRAERKAWRQEQREKRQAEREERRKQQEEEQTDSRSFLTGEQGKADTFLFKDLSDFGVQAETPDFSIHSLNQSLMFTFEDGLDKIDLSNFDADTTQDGKQAFEFIGTGDFSGTAGELRIVGQSAITGDIDGDGVGDFYFQFRDGFYTNTVELTAEDFILGEDAPAVPAGEDTPVSPEEPEIEPVPAPEGNIIHKQSSTYLRGNDGEADIFVFDSLDDFGVQGDAPSQGAKLQDFAMFWFEDGLDFIDLSGIDANQNTAGDDAFTFIGAQDFSGQAGELQITNGTSIRGDVDGDGNADFFFDFRDGFYTNSVALTESDFVL